MDTRTLVDHARTLDCIHCGLCLRTCPTYQLSGAEQSSPRGRIHLMRSVAEGELAPDAGFADEMDFCLLCRHCESVCPAGVRFGLMMETTRAGLARQDPRSLLARLASRLGFGLVLPRRALLSLGAALLSAAQRSGLVARLAPHLGERGRALAAFPAVPPRAERALLPTLTPARGERAGRVALLEGCVMPALLGGVNRATARVLAAAGYEVRTARGAVCCGSLHAHNGELEGARRLARATIAAFELVHDDDGRPAEVVVNSAGCAAHMKEYAELLRDDPAWRTRAAAFAARVRDFSEHLARRALARVGRELARSPELATPIAYDDPCHLCHGQQIRDEPRALLDLLSDTPRVELDESESCCGSAGIYSLLRPADSRAILAGRLDALERSGARTLVTANPGCQLQWRSGIAARGLAVEVLHVAEALERALPRARAGVKEAEGAR